MSWDRVMAIAQAVLAVFIVPILLDTSAQVPRLTSGVFSVSLAVVGLALYNLKAPTGAVTVTVSALLWAAVFVFRG